MISEALAAAMRDLAEFGSVSLNSAADAAAVAQTAREMGAAVSTDTVACAWLVIVEARALKRSADR